VKQSCRTESKCCASYIQTLVMRVVFAAFALSGLATGSGPACTPIYPQACTSENFCETIGLGVWISVDNATDLPGTAIDGGRRYTLGQKDKDFKKNITAPNGGYCLAKNPPISDNCSRNATLCNSMESCMYRTDTGRWFRDDISSTCVSNCSHPLVFCDKNRCDSTMGCTWFIKSQSNADECFCYENPGIYGNPPKKPSLTWIFWDQPWSLLAFIPACIAALALGYYIFVFNIKPLWAKCCKKKPANSQA
jgi:hypothetical protein